MSAEVTHTSKEAVRVHTNGGIVMNSGTRNPVGITRTLRQIPEPDIQNIHSSKT